MCLNNLKFVYKLIVSIIQDALKSNNTLLSLELSGNSINNDVLKKIYDIL